LHSEEKEKQEVGHVVDRGSEHFNQHSEVRELLKATNRPQTDDGRSNDQQELANALFVKWRVEHIGSDDVHNDSQVADDIQPVV